VLGDDDRPGPAGAGRSRAGRADAPVRAISSGDLRRPRGGRDLARRRRADGRQLHALTADTGAAPQVLAALRNAVIGLLRLRYNPVDAADRPSLHGHLVVGTVVVSGRQSRPVWHWSCVPSAGDRYRIKLRSAPSAGARPKQSDAVFGRSIVVWRRRRPRRRVRSYPQRLTPQMPPTGIRVRTAAVHPSPTMARASAGPPSVAGSAMGCCGRSISMPTTGRLFGGARGGRGRWMRRRASCDRWSDGAMERQHQARRARRRPGPSRRLAIGCTGSRIEEAGRRRTQTERHRAVRLRVVLKPATPRETHDVSTGLAGCCHDLTFV